MSFATVRVTATVTVGGNPPANATGRWQLNAPMTDGANSYIAARPVPVTFDRQGRMFGPDRVLGVALERNDQAQGTGYGWTFRLIVDGVAQPDQTYVLTAAMGSTIDLAVLAPSPPANAAYGYVSLTQLATALTNPVDGGTPTSNAGGQTVDGGTP